MPAGPPSSALDTERCKRAKLEEARLASSMLREETVVRLDGFVKKRVNWEPASKITVSPRRKAIDFGPRNQSRLPSYLLNLKVLFMRDV